MAKIPNNNAASGLKGRVDQFVYRQRYGETIVGKKPRRSARSTSSQDNVRNTFREAATYAKAALTNSLTMLFYKAKAKLGRSAYNMAVADFFIPPQIGNIDASLYNGSIGSTIEVPVTDNGKVMSVSVQVKKANGTLIEEGAAVLQSDGLHWRYTATVSNASPAGSLIIISATDMPKHSSVKQFNL